MKSYVKNFGSHFAINEEGAHMSASTFARNAKLEFDLYSGKRTDQFLTKVNDIKQLTTNGARLDLALKLAESKIFVLPGGTRQYAPKVLVILLTGTCTGCTEKLQDRAQKLKDGGVKVIVVSFGGKSNDSELKEMASLPDETHIFKPANVRALNESATIHRPVETINSCKYMIVFA